MRPAVTEQDDSRRGGRFPPRDFLALCAVGAVLLVASGLALAFVQHGATAVPALDDVTQIPAMLADFHPNATWLWMQHNDHRIPLPHLLYIGLVRGAHDFRAAAFVDLGLVGLTAAAFLGAARAVRGRTRLVDAFFPLAWLSWSHSENLLNSFQIVFVTSTVIVAACTIAVATAQRRPSAGTIAVVALGACMLPLCSLVGVVQAPCLAVWLGWAWLSARGTAGSRRAGVLAAIGAIGAPLIIALTMIGFEHEHGVHHPAPARGLLVAAHFLASPGGWALAGVLEVAAGVAVIAFLAGLVLIARRAWNEPDARARWLGLALIQCGILALALAIGFGRGGEDDAAGSRSRYAMIALPWLCALFLAACLVERRESARRAWIARAVQIGMVLVAAWTYVANLEPAAALARVRVEAAAGLERDVARGQSYSQLAAAHWQDFYYQREDYVQSLHWLDRGGFAPFARARGPDDHLLVGCDPFDEVFRGEAGAVGATRPDVRTIDRWRVLAVEPDELLEWPLPEDVACVRGWFGVPSQAWRAGCGPMRFVVDVVGADGRKLATFERRLDPERVKANRFRQDFGLPFERGPGRRLRLSVVAEPGAGRAPGSGWWDDVRVR